MAEEVSPPWGALPPEQYLIRNWDPSSPLPPATQRQNLIRAFNCLDPIPPEWNYHKTNTLSRVPTPDEIATILSPWRDLRIRATAALIMSGTISHVVTLRTFYSPSSDEKFKQMIEDEKEADGMWDDEDYSWRYLDDASVWDFSSPEDGEEEEEKPDWRVRLLDVLPEIVGCPYGQRWGVNPQDIEKARSGEEGALEWVRQMAHICGMVVLVATEDEIGDEGDGEYEVAHLDGFGNVIVHSSVGPDNVPDLRLALELGRMDTGAARWTDGDLGDEYEEGGKMWKKIFEE